MSALDLLTAASLILLGADPVVPTAGAPEKIVESVRADLARRTGAASGAMKVVRAEEVVFADGSLDCPDSGQSYTQATVPGYRVVLKLGERQYDYRVTRRGSLRLCDRGARPR
jgi:hypothetical protein